MVDSSLQEANPSYHKLSDNWTFWAHLPHDTDWTVKSYKKLLCFNSAEEIITLSESLPETMVKNCMLFLMRDGIHPTWEDPKNRQEGVFLIKLRIR